MSDEFFSLMNLVPPAWWRYYGITDDRYTALRNPEGKRYSIYYGGSEEALTLFVLGNIDGWTQARYVQHPARNPENGWNDRFFTSIRQGASIFNYSDRGRLQRWTEFLSKVPALANYSADDACLVFELELVNQNFNRCRSTPTQRFDRVSFLGKRTRWSQFDAALLLPKEKRIVLIEAKLDADSASGVTEFVDVPQIIRNLEVAYFVTQHSDSQWQGWDCQYLFLYPDRANRNYLIELDGLQRILQNHQTRLQGEYNQYLLKCDQETQDKFACYDAFVEWALQRTSKLAWSELDGIGGFKYSDYLRRSSASGLHSAATLAELGRRFPTAGISIVGNGPPPPPPGGNGPLTRPPPSQPGQVQRGQVFRNHKGQLIVVAGPGTDNHRVVPLKDAPGHFPESYLVAANQFPTVTEAGHDTKYSLPSTGSTYFYDAPNGDTLQVTVTRAGEGRTSRVRRADGSGDAFPVPTHNLRTDQPTR